MLFPSSFVLLHHNLSNILQFSPLSNPKVLAFQEIVASLRLVIAKGVTPPWKKLLNINIGIRHNTLDYSDKFQWNVLSDSGKRSTLSCASYVVPSVHPAPYYTNELRVE